jgi:hypothetical protein
LYSYIFCGGNHFCVIVVYEAVDCGMKENDSKEITSLYHVPVLQKDCFIVAEHTSSILIFELLAYLQKSWLYYKTGYFKTCSDL